MFEILRLRELAQIPLQPAEIKLYPPWYTFDLLSRLGNKDRWSPGKQCQTLINGLFMETNCLLRSLPLSGKRIFKKILWQPSLFLFLINMLIPSAIFPSNVNIEQLHYKQRLWLCHATFKYL